MLYISRAQSGLQRTCDRTRAMWSGEGASARSRAYFVVRTNFYTQGSSPRYRCAGRGQDQVTVGKDPRTLARRAIGRRVATRGCAIRISLPGAATPVRFPCRPPTPLSSMPRGACESRRSSGIYRVRPGRQSLADIGEVVLQVQDLRTSATTRSKRRPHIHRSSRARRLRSWANQPVRKSISVSISMGLYPGNLRLDRTCRPRTQPAPGHAGVGKPSGRYR